MAWVVLLLVFSQDKKIDEAIAKSAAILLECQEGDLKAQWPYEGVYRVQKEIPVGYRVGGTSFCAMALLEVPGEDKTRAEAIDRAAAFVIETLKDPLMAKELKPAYDVRAWGHIYALQFLLRLEKLGRAPKGSKDAIEFCIDALAKLEIPENGGWNYACCGTKKPDMTSTFMTAPGLLALWQAKAQGYKVSEDVLTRALLSLENARLDDGAFQYALRKGSKEPMPGAIGRSPLCEMTLLLAGKSTPEKVQQAVEAFFKSWEELEKRRQQQGTHAGPYKIAPYYFFFAHAYVAQAIEFVPEDQRAKFRNQLYALLFKIREADGSWNDRVFPRSKNFGTACALLAFLAPKLPKPMGARPR